MAFQRKLGRTAGQRKALLRNQVTQLIWYGQIETTLARAKEVQPIAEKLITLAMGVYDQSVEATKEYHNEKGQLVTLTVQNDTPQKLAVRRRIMAYLYDLKAERNKDEDKDDFKERSKANNHPVVEKLFREYAPKFAKRNAEKGCAGGYTRILKKGPRRGDAAEMVLLQILK